MNIYVKMESLSKGIKDRKEPMNILELGNKMNRRLTRWAQHQNKDKESYIRRQSNRNIQPENVDWRKQQEPVEQSQKFLKAPDRQKKDDRAEKTPKEIQCSPFACERQGLRPLKPWVVPNHFATVQYQDSHYDDSYDH